MTEANAEKRAPHVRHEAADRSFLVAQPGITILLPHILWAAHDNHAVEGIERRNRFALVELDHLPGGAILLKERLKDAEMLDLFMLQNENMHGQSLLALDCRSHQAGSRIKPDSLEVMPILADAITTRPERVDDERCDRLQNCMLLPHDANPARNFQKRQPVSGSGSGDAFAAVDDQRVARHKRRAV